MRHRLNRILAVACLLALPPASAALAANPWTNTFYFENDLFNGTDSNYTNGVKYSIISPDLSPERRDQGRLPKKVLERVQNLPFIARSGAQTSHRVEFSLGQNIYTPADISRSDLIVTDRPYGGWGYFGTSYHHKEDSGSGPAVMDTAEVQLGMVGPLSLAEESQKLVHRLRDLQRPNGWDHGLDNEPGIVLAFERKWLNHPDLRGRFGADTIFHAGGALGNVATYLNGGAELRLGWNIPRTFGVSLIRPAGSTWLASVLGLSVYGFAGGNGRLVLRDIFLDGNTFAHSHGVDKKFAVADFAAGIAATWDFVSLSFSENLRTKEFDGQPKSHSYGSMSLSFSFLF
ncbi:MAG: lipid A deacylase LpxR family protein [Thermodesulfobacteriota bacterium]